MHSKFDGYLAVTAVISGYWRFSSCAAAALYCLAVRGGHKFEFNNPFVREK